MRQRTSRIQCGGHSHPSCVTTIEAFVKPTHVWTLFSCAHVVCREFTISCFSAVRKRFFLIGACPTSFLRLALRSKIVWRVPHVFLSTIVRNIARFVKKQVQTIFETTHWCATCVVVAASSHSVFKHVRGRVMFF